MIHISSKPQTGQAMVEFTLVFALVGIVSTATVMLFGPKIGGSFNAMSTALPPLRMGGIPVEINPATFTPTVTPLFPPTRTPTLAPTQTPVPTATRTAAPTPTATLTYKQWCLAQGPNYRWNWLGQCIYNYHVVTPPP